jgi:glycosyltransferase involved in cell wall biosynthesis
MKKVYIDKLYKDWILGGIFRESSALSGQKISILYTPTSKYSLSNVFARLFNKKIHFNPGDIVVNQGTLFSLIEQKRIDLNSLSNVHCYFTHDSKTNLLMKSELLTQLKLIFTMNRKDAEVLIEIGVDPSRIKVVYGAVDSKLFYPRESAENLNPFVYVTGDAKGRKNPDKILKLIHESPELHFKINGRFWREYLINRSIELKNLELLNFDLLKNPKLMRDASCFLSLSLHEGGPYPVLEALASGTPVVVTPTGWNPEIVSKENGCIVDFDIEISDLKLVLQRMIELKKHVYFKDLTNAGYSWEKLAVRLYEV